jgi:multiple sugar transport system substrate-binding protein
MKKVLIFLLVFLTMVTLYAGGGKEQSLSVSDSPVKQFDGTTIYLIMEQSAPTEALEKLFPQFEELTGIEIVLEKAPYDDVVQKETLAFVSQRGAYDLIAAPYEFLGNMVTNNYIQSIEPFLENEALHVIPSFNKDDLIPGLWNACGEWEGNLYGTPSNLCVMFYGFRKDLMGNTAEKAAFESKYGYPLAEPTNWKEYRDIAEFFTRKKGDMLAGEVLENNFYGVSMSGKRHPATVFEWMNYMWSFGGGFFDDDGELIINSKENIDALEYYVNLTEFAPPGVSSKTWDEQTTELQQGIVAQAVFFNDCAPSVEDPDSSLMVGKMGYGAIPAEKAEVAHFGGWGFYIPTDAKNPEASWVFLQWFLSKEIQKTLAEQGFFPGLASVYDDAELESTIPYWSASKAAFEICSQRPRIPEWNSMSEVMQLEISKAISGEITASEAIKNLEIEFNDILKNSLPVTYQ